MIFHSYVSLPEGKPSEHAPRRSLTISIAGKKNQVPSSWGLKFHLTISHPMSWATWLALEAMQGGYGINWVQDLRHPFFFRLPWAAKHALARGIQGSCITDVHPVSAIMAIDNLESVILQMATQTPKTTSLVLWSTGGGPAAPWHYVTLANVMFPAFAVQSALVAACRVTFLVAPAIENLS